MRSAAEMRVRDFMTYGHFYFGLAAEVREVFFGDVTIKRVDPPDCGCTDCLCHDWSCPVNGLSAEEERSFRWGFLDNATSESIEHWVDSDFGWRKDVGK